MNVQPISALMQRAVSTIGLDDTLEQVEALFASKGLSWAPVVEPAGQVVGVISASDLLQWRARREDAVRMCAWQLCTYKPISVTADTPVSEVARLMTAHRLHHVVVMDGADIAGVVSSLDFVRTFHE
jgi:CBS domain-containing protein